MAKSTLGNFALVAGTIAGFAGMKKILSAGAKTPRAIKLEKLSHEELADLSGIFQNVMAASGFEAKLSGQASTLKGKNIGKLGFTYSAAEGLPAEEQLNRLKLAAQFVHESTGLHLTFYHQKGVAEMHPAQRASPITINTLGQRHSFNPAERGWITKRVRSFRRS